MMARQSWSMKSQAFVEKQALALRAQPTSLRRCLQCDAWMRSTGPDNRICNPCKGLAVNPRMRAGSRVKAC